MNAKRAPKTEEEWLSSIESSEIYQAFDDEAVNYTEEDWHAFTAYFYEDPKYGPLVNQPCVNVHMRQHLADRFSYHGPEVLSKILFVLFCPIEEVPLYINYRFDLHIDYGLYYGVYSRTLCLDMIAKWRLDRGK